MDSARIKDYTIYFENSKEFHILKREIFGEHCYYTEFDKADPYIIDAGAHIGLASLYFKMLSPKARILAIEPNPEVIKILRKNLFENLVEGVEVEEVALGVSAGEESFYVDKSDDGWYSTGGFIEGAWNRSQYSRSFRVPTRPLVDYLDQEVDLLKMDIEGVEMKVLLAAGQKIRKVRRMLMEFHGVGENSLPRIVEFLEEQGFSVEVSKAGVKVRRDKIEKVTGLALVEANRE